MKVNIGPIREMPGGTVHFQGGQPVPDLKLDLIFEGPAYVKGTITNTGEGFLVKASLEFGYRVNCSRCLKEFESRRQIEMMEEFLPATASPGEKEDDLAFYFSGDVIDLQDCISEQVLFSLPMNFICKPECKGLCPECGQDLNIARCSCVSETSNPQFEKLKYLLSTEGGGQNGKSKK